MCEGSFAERALYFRALLQKLPFVLGLLCGKSPTCWALLWKEPYFIGENGPYFIGKEALFHRRKWPYEISYFIGKNGPMK